MLSSENNDLLTLIEPGSIMGNLLRHFWMPALLEEEIIEPDGAPVRLRLMGEDLVAFKDTEGKIGILDAYCAHRRANLFFGRNEECGLRCVYHGWKYDVTGQCVDMPSEPDDSRLANKIQIKSYPTVLRGGVIWVYMGPKEFTPEPPNFEWSTLPASQRYATKRLQQCNWAQAVEGGIDSSHISFLHSRSDKQLTTEVKVPRNKLHSQDRHPVFFIKETDFGLSIGARRHAGDKNYYWRITQFLLPFYTMIPPVGEFEHSGDQPYNGHAWVPIDNYNTWSWSFGAHPHNNYEKSTYDFLSGKNGMWGPITADYLPVQNIGNDYLINREAQKTENFTGIEGIPNQDAAVQESMGGIVDRSKEHLGTSDTAVIAFRKLLLKLVKEYEVGKTPSAAFNGECYNVRSASLLLERDIDWQQGAAHLISRNSLL